MTVPHQCCWSTLFENTLHSFLTSKIPSVNSDQIATLRLMSVIILSTAPESGHKPETNDCELNALAITLDGLILNDGRPRDMTPISVHYIVHMVQLVMPSRQFQPCCRMSHDSDPYVLSVWLGSGKNECCVNCQNKQKSYILSYSPTLIAFNKHHQDVSNDSAIRPASTRPSAYYELLSRKQVAFLTNSWSDFYDPYCCPYSEGLNSMLCWNNYAEKCVSPIRRIWWSQSRMMYQQPTTGIHPDPDCDQIREKHVRFQRQSKRKFFHLVVYKFSSFFSTISSTLMCFRSRLPQSSARGLKLAELCWWRKGAPRYADNAKTSLQQFLAEITYVRALHLILVILRMDNWRCTFSHT